MPARISIGSNVKAKLGPFAPIQPLAFELNAQPAKRCRRQRAFLYGVVVKSLPNQKWKVYWNGIQKTGDQEISTIKIAGPDTIMEPAV